MRNSRKENIALIADDDMFIRKILMRTLDGLCEFKEVTDGKDVLKAYMEQMPDVTFLDIHMPHINGLELIKKIKSVDPDAYIIMLTSDSRKENVEVASQNGAAGFVAKPFNKKTVLTNFYRCPTIYFGG